MTILAIASPSTVLLVTIVLSLSGRLIAVAQYPYSRSIAAAAGSGRLSCNLGPVPTVSWLIVSRMPRP